MRRDLTEAEIRILGCLIEKQRTTPDAYPLTFNSLRLACNQTTNRDPVVDYDEATVREALGRLGRRRFIRSGSAQGSRAAKYRHLLGEELPLPDAEMALMATLALRGPQTPGELKQRAGRMHPFAGLAEVLEALEGLIERELVRRLPRRPGQKEERYEQLLGDDRVDGENEGAEEAPMPQRQSETPAAEASLRDEVAALRAEFDALAERVDRIEGG